MTIYQQQLEDSLECIPMGSSLSCDLRASAIDFLGEDAFNSLSYNPEKTFELLERSCSFSSNDINAAGDHPAVAFNLEAPETAKRQTKVRFSTVETRSYALTIGDHPHCTDGLPLSLDWAYNPQAKIESVPGEEDDAFTCHYPPQQLSYFERKVRLLNAGGMLVQETLQQQEMEKAKTWKPEVEIQLEDIMYSQKVVVSQAA